MSKPYCLSPNSLPEWQLLPISLRHVIAKAMKKLEEAQGVVAKNSVFIELPQNLQEDAVKKRATMKANKNSVSVDACSILVLKTDGTPTHNHEIFAQELAKAVKEHGNDYGAGVIVNGQVIGTVSSRGHVKILADKIQAETPAAPATPPSTPATPPATPPTGEDVPPTGDNTPPAGDGANAESGNKKSNKKS